MQRAVFIRSVNEDFLLVMELLDLVPMKGKTDADKIFSDMLNLFSKLECP
jgi:hypothetical protein